MKKRKLNSTNPKYIKDTVDSKPVIKEKRLITDKGKIKAYAVFYDD